MRLYEADKHELLMLYWYLELRKDTVEFENLFAEPLRSLTSMLSWAKSSVNIMFDSDDVGIRFAAWCAPYFSGAEFGAWSRKDSRGTKAHLKFMDEAYERSLSQYPMLIGITCQPELHNIHLKLGYEFKCEISGLFDGKPARVYVLTAEGRANRFNISQEMKNGFTGRKNIHVNGHKPIRSPNREVQQSISPGGEDVRSATGGSSKNGRNRSADTDHKPRRGRKPRSGVVTESGDATSAG